MKRIYSVLCLAACPLVGYAQSNKESQRPVNLEEVIVSASRIPESIKQSAATVTVISRQQVLDAAKFNPDVPAILAYLVPGMASATNTTSNRSQTLRGRQALVLIDGIPQSTPLRSTDRDFRSIDPAAIDHIEVIKGATSIYGNGAGGGIINIITKRASGDKAISGMTTVGMRSHRLGSRMFSADGGFGYELGQQLTGAVGKVDYLLNASYRHTGVSLDGDGAVISPRYGLGENGMWNVLAKLGYHFDEKNRLEAMYNFYSSLQDSKYITKKGKYLETPATGILGEDKGVNQGTRYNHNMSLSYTSKELLPHTDLSLSTYYQDLYTIFDYRTAPRWQNQGGQATIRDRKLGVRPQLTTSLTWRDDYASQLTYGIDFLLDRTAQPIINEHEDPKLPSVNGKYWVPWLKSINLAPYLQTKHQLAKDWVLKAGLRYDYLKVIVDDYSTLPDGTNTPVQVTGGDLIYKKLTTNFGLAYTGFKPLQPYVAFSQGFSIYDLGRVLRAAKQGELSKINTEPVVTNNYELGLNSEPLRGLTLSGSLFLSTAAIGNDLVSENSYWVADRSPQRVWGFELSAQYEVTKYLRLKSDFSWQEGKKKPAGHDSYDAYMSGLLIAPAKWTIGVQTRPLTDLRVNAYYILTGTRDRFTPNAKGVYQEGEGPARSISLFNLDASYQLNKKFALTLGIENLFNQTYYTQASMVNARDAEYAHGNGTYYTLRAQYNF